MDSNLSVEPGRAPTITLAKLEPWTANTDEGVKYFSGTATYTKTVQVDRRSFRQGSQARERILLNLGIVNDLAEVSVNGSAIRNLMEGAVRG